MKGQNFEGDIRDSTILSEIIQALVTVKQIVLKEKPFAMAHIAALETLQTALRDAGGPTSEAAKELWSLCAARFAEKHDEWAGFFKHEMIGIHRSDLADLDRAMDALRLTAAGTNDGSTWWSCCPSDVDILTWFGQTLDHIRPGPLEAKARKLKEVLLWVGEG